MYHVSKVFERIMYQPLNIKLSKQPTELRRSHSTQSDLISRMEMSKAILDK